MANLGEKMGKPRATFRRIVRKGRSGNLRKSVPGRIYRSLSMRTCRGRRGRVRGHGLVRFTGLSWFFFHPANQVGCC